MRAIVYVREENEFDSLLDWGDERRLVDQWCNMIGFEHIIIDKTKTMNKTNGNVFYDFQDMINMYPEHRIVFLDINSKNNLKNCNHKKDENVIYCIGSEIDGFGDLNLTDKETYKIFTTNKIEYHTLTVCSIIIADKLMRDK